MINFLLLNLKIENLSALFYFHLDTASYLTGPKQYSELLEKCGKIPDPSMYCRDESFECFLAPVGFEYILMYRELMLSFAVRYHY